MKFLSLLLLFISINVYALEFKPGTGSQFLMLTEGQEVDLSIYVADKKSDRLSVEMHFGASGIILTNMWQQFEFKLQHNSPLSIEAGYIKTKPENSPEKMTNDFFKQNTDGVQVQDFLFSDAKSIQKHFIADEVVELPAGSVKAKHYQRINNDQTVDFWIAESVGPISLVKLVSTSRKNKKNNYSIELAILLQNVKPSINPKEAIPLTKDTAKILRKPKK